MEKIPCQTCNQEFTPRDYRQVYCQRKCFKKAYYRKHIKENKAYYEANREKSMEYQRKWRLANPDARKLYYQKTKESNQVNNKAT